MYWGDAKPKIHLIGIGGSGMSGIAEVLLASGFSVQGSDSSHSFIVERLRELGAHIQIGHRAEHLGEATCVVVSSAISPSNPEWQEALRRQIPVIPRAEMLAELMRLKKGVAVVGSHGKTTTTSMLGQILRSLDPTVVVGGRLQHWNASSRVGQGDLFVIEADESDRSFLKFSPVYSLVTNIDLEHLDTYRDLDDIENTFLEFLNRTAFFGVNWVCTDCPSLRKLRPKISKPVKTYGFSDDADLKIAESSWNGKVAEFRLIYEGQDLGFFQLPVAGRHNLKNAAGAIGVSLSLGLSPDQIREVIREFIPADRRLQVHCDGPRSAVIEDYGHHPTEIAATLEAVAQMYPNRQRFVVFQPHRYTRTKALWNQFVEVFSGKCDRLLLLPIYAAHEEALPGVSSELLAESIQDKVKVKAIASVPLAHEVLSELEILPDADPYVLLVLGAGPLTPLAQQLRLKV